jgi:predicted membrane chloride channel (bestrophin family)
MSDMEKAESSVPFDYANHRYWAQLVMTTRNIARVVWIHAKERNGDLGKQDLLGKLYLPFLISNSRTCINILLGFLVATKYRLRRQPGYDYPDLRPFIQNLSTFAKESYLADGTIRQKQYHPLRQVGQFLGVPGTSSDPLKPLRKGPRYHGNLPLEILTHLSAYFEIIISNDTFKVSIMHTIVMNSMTSLLDCLTGMERVLGTPLPVAYNIAISQITWAYILILPFQLYTTLGWIAIPGTLG